MGRINIKNLIKCLEENKNHFKFIDYFWGIKISQKDKKLIGDFYKVIKNFNHSKIRINSKLMGYISQS